LATILMDHSSILRICSNLGSGMGSDVNFWQEGASLLTKVGIISNVLCNLLAC
jgi:hypothetical protein